MKIRAFLLLPISLALSTTAAAAALQASPKATGEVVFIAPLSVVKVDDLDFGYLAAPTAGAAVIDPNTAKLTTTGGVVALGGNPHPAQFIGASQNNSVVNIKLPNGAITLTRNGGTETMSLTALTLQGQSKRTLAARESFTFNVGGTLNVAANQAQGIYTGTFDIQIQYP